MSELDLPLAIREDGDIICDYFDISCVRVPYEVRKHRSDEWSHAAAQRIFILLVGLKGMGVTHGDARHGAVGGRVFDIPPLQLTWIR